MKRTKALSLLSTLNALLIFIWLYAAASKLFDYTHNYFNLQQSPLLAPVAGLLRWLIPAVEIVLVLLLLAPYTRKFALYFSLFLLINFTVYIGYLLLFVPNLPCSGGGLLQALTWKQHVLLNVFLIAINILALKIQIQYAGN